MMITNNMKAKLFTALVMGWTLLQGTVNAAYTAQTVSILFDSTKVDASASGEAAHIRDSVGAAGHTYNTVTTYAAWITSLSSTNAAVIPELETGTITCSASDKTALLNFLNGGGRLLMAGQVSTNDSNCLNSCFGDLGVVTGNGGNGAWAENTSDRTLSVWAGNSYTSLPSSNGAYGLSVSGTTATHYVAYGTTANVGAVQFDLNGGHVFFLAFDWFQTPVPASWQEALDNVFGVATTGGAGGDPHFYTWSGNSYDFHGHCDLVLLNTPSMGERHGNKGLSIHIRSAPFKIFFSFISDVAVRIGDDILEIGAQKHYINGVPQEIGSTEVLSGYPVVSSVAHKKPRYTYKVQLGGKEEIIFREYKGWITVTLINAPRGDFGNSVGLMGNYGTGAWLGRDGTTVHSDINAFGHEWQVHGGSDGFLFRVPSAYPKQCDIPMKHAEAKLRGRRLLLPTITREEALRACAHWGSAIEDCVVDVQTAGDLEMAGEAPFQ